MKNPFTREVPRLPAPRAERFLHAEPLNSIATQQLVTLLIDRSSSMDGSPIQQVNRGAASFASELSDDPLTRDTLQVQLVTFGATVAPTNDEAIAMAESIDGAHFRPAPRWDNWQIDSADPVPEDEPFEPLDERYSDLLISALCLLARSGLFLFAGKGVARLRFGRLFLSGCGK